MMPEPMAGSPRVSRLRATWMCDETCGACVGVMASASVSVVAGEGKGGAIGRGAYLLARALDAGLAMDVACDELVAPELLLLAVVLDDAALLLSHGREQNLRAEECGNVEACAWNDGGDERRSGRTEPGRGGVVVGGRALRAVMCSGWRSALAGRDEGAGQQRRPK